MVETLTQATPERTLNEGFELSSSARWCACGRGQDNERNGSFVADGRPLESLALFLQLNLSILKERETKLERAVYRVAYQAVR